MRFDRLNLIKLTFGGLTDWPQQAMPVPGWHQQPLLFSTVVVVAQPTMEVENTSLSPLLSPLPSSLRPSLPTSLFFSLPSSLPPSLSIFYFLLLFSSSHPLALTAPCYRKGRRASGH